jgi:hypothetical protein
MAKINLLLGISFECVQVGLNSKALKVYLWLTVGGTAKTKAACSKISDNSTLTAGFHDDIPGASEHFVSLGYQERNDPPPRHLVLRSKYARSGREVGFLDSENFRPKLR